jgi:hypothetical protein
MSLKSASRELADSERFAPAIAWLKRALTVLRSVLQALTMPYYRGAATGAAVAGVTLGLLIFLDPSSAQQSPATPPLTAAQQLPASSQPVTPGQPAQTTPGHTRQATAPGQPPARAGTPALGPTAWQYPTGAPSLLISPSPSRSRSASSTPTRTASHSPTPVRSVTVPPPPSPTPTPSSTPTPTPTPTQTQSLPPA